MAAELTAESPPRMSYVVATDDDFETIRPVIDVLRRQTVSDQLEVVLPGLPPQALAQAEHELDGFRAVKAVTTGPSVSLGEARAAGVRAASAPIVFIGETHSFPHSQLAETLLEAHAGPWAAVTPAVGNANPEGALSWAGFLSDCGAWVEGLPSGEIEFAPIYNASYRRSVLLEFGDNLGSALSHGDMIRVAFRARRHRTYFESTATIDHLNTSGLGDYVRVRFWAGVAIGAQRAQRWSWHRRLLYLCGAPLLPAVYLARVRSGVGPARRKWRVPRGTSPAMLLGALVKAAGEMAGYAFGPQAGGEARLAEYELHKVAYTSHRAR
jgi:hypothetical protein